MKLQQFNGGEHSKPRPQFIETNQGQVYVNIDVDAGSLAPVKLPKVTDTELGKFFTFFYAGNKFVSSDVRRYYVEFQRNLYWCDGKTPPQKLSATGQQGNLGIVRPDKLNNFATTSHPEAIEDVKIEPLSDKTVGLPMEDQFYLLLNESVVGYSEAFQFVVTTKDKVVTIQQATSKPEIRPKVNSTKGDNAKRQVKISNIKGVTRGNVGYKLFRQYSGKYYLVGLFESTITDKVENISGNEQLDMNKFGALKGTYQYVMTYLNDSDGAESAPSDVSKEIVLKDGGDILLTKLPVSEDKQVTKKNLYRVGGLLAEFSLVKTLDNDLVEFKDNIRDTKVHGQLLTTKNAYQAPSDILYLTEAYAMLFAAQGSKLRFTPVGKPDEWPESYYLQFDSDITGLAPVSNGILVFTTARTFIVTGNGPTTLSQYLLSSDQGCISHSSISRIGPEAVWVSQDGICSSSGNIPRVLTKDKLGKLNLKPIDSTIYGEKYYLLEADGNILCYSNDVVSRFKFDTARVASLNNKLYGWNNGKLLELFASNDNAKLSFVSAKLVEGKFTASKTYKKIFLYSSGHVIIKILINDVVVQTKELNTTDSHTIQVPQNLQRGFYIQFHIEGTGEVSELEYTVGE